MRPIWTGSVSFGLVNIPVRMFSGVHPHQGIDLAMLHKQDKSPIRFARICRKDGEEVSWDDIVKGYEYRDGDYVVLTQKELDSIDAEHSQTIDVQHFVQEGEIDIRYFEKPYYLEPIKGGEKAYALLHAALEQSDKLALAKFVIHQREHIGVIKPVGRALVLNQMRYPTDLREGTDLTLPDGKNISDAEVKVALKFVAQETAHFVPEDYRDTYTEELEEIIKEKTKGKKITPKRHAAPTETSAKDLMSALKASLKQE